MEEIQRRSSEQRTKEPRVGSEEELRSRGIEGNEGWIRGESWVQEPDPEIVERLIGWFSDECH